MKINMKQERRRKGQDKDKDTKTNIKDKHTLNHSLVLGHQPRQGKARGRVQTIEKGLKAGCRMYDAHMRIRVSLKREKLKR